MSGKLVQGIPSRELLEQEVVALEDHEQIELTQVIYTSTSSAYSGERVECFLIQISETAHILQYDDSDGWEKQGTFEAESLDEEDRYDEATELIDMPPSTRVFY
ncbi:hypothetical protein [Natronorubrum sp. A-ect3]|uniref:hypothetical protein n=1 Tax=Natronorubrum sp. A-ect3 TaxID=3242698 RepID=UPI00359CE41F